MFTNPKLYHIPMVLERSTVVEGDCRVLLRGAISKAWTRIERSVIKCQTYSWVNREWMESQTNRVTMSKTRKLSCFVKEWLQCLANIKYINSPTRVTLLTYSDNIVFKFKYLLMKYIFIHNHWTHLAHPSEPCHLSIRLHTINVNFSRTAPVFSLFLGSACSSNQAWCCPNWARGARAISTSPIGVFVTVFSSNTCTCREALASEGSELWNGDNKINETETFTDA